MTADEQGYNGWTNYPTWAVNLWLSNDEGLYRQTLEMVATFRRGNHPRVVLADRLKSWVTDDLAPDLGASFAADLLGYALGEVDWDEIAAAWIANADE